MADEEQKKRKKEEKGRGGGGGGSSALVSEVRQYYNHVNVHTEKIVMSLDHHLSQRQKAVFDSLGQEIKNRHLGLTLNVPENVEGKRVLDIGCGAGSLVFILSKLVGPTGYVVGFDLSEGLIQTAKDQSDYHRQLWGYDQSNFEFHVLNAEELDQAHFREEEFDIIVASAVFCVIPDKERVLRAVHKLLKPGGQFRQNDIVAEKDAPGKCRDDLKLWALGATGAMRWEWLCSVAQTVGFSCPHLTSVSPILITNTLYQSMLDNGRFACAGWRLFKPNRSLTKRVVKGPSLVTYNGGITDYPDDFPWDVDLTFKRGKGVEVDGELSSLLSSIYLSHCFTFQPLDSTPNTSRAQDPFQTLDRLKRQGQHPPPVYTIE